MQKPVLRSFFGLWVLCVVLLGMPGCSQPEPLIAAAKHPDAERVRGTRVSLVQPAGWQPAPSFAGFADPDSYSSLMVTTLPGPLSEALTGFESQPRLALQGMQIVKREPLPQGTYPGEFMELTQKSNQGEFLKWIWVFGSETECVTIMGLCPVGSPQEQRERIVAAVRSATWEPDFDLDPKAELTFFISDEGGMVLMPGITGGLTYTSDGKIDQDGAEGKPLFVLAPALQSTPDEAEAYASKRLRRVAGQKKVKPGELLPITIDGLKGFECIATSIHRKSTEPEFIYQVMLFDGASHWVMQGIARETDRAKQLPVFQRMARSFQRKFETISMPDGPASMEVPMDWNTRSGINEEADLTAGNLLTQMVTTVLAEPKAGLDEGWTFEKFTNQCVGGFAEGTEPVAWDNPTEIAGLHAAQFRYVFEDDPRTYVITTLEGEDHYHQIVQWCLTEWEDYSLPSLQRALESFQEAP